MASQQEEPLTAIIQIFQSGSVLARRQAAEALLQLGHEAETAIPPLIAALGNEDRFVRSGAAEVLALIGPPAVPFLVSALRNADPVRRKMAVLALALIGPEAKAALIPLRMLALEQEIGPLAARAVRKIQGPSRLGAASRLRLSFLLWAAAPLVLAGSLAALYWAGQALSPLAQGLAATAAGGLALIGAVLGAVVGGNNAGRRGAFLGALMIAVGGACAGLLVGGIVGSLVSPAARVLGGP
jgi:hypothetical protein